MTEDQRIKAAQLIHENARQYRGSFLNLIACIEHDIAHLLTDYFCTICPDKRRIFYEEIVTEEFFSLYRKKNVLIKIVKVDYPRYWNDKKDFLKTFDKVLEFRNKLAHSVVDVSEKALSRPIEEGIGFKDWDNGTPITSAEFNDWEVKAKMIYSCLNDIKRLLPFKEKPII
ncbi:MAG: hypothetical protein KBD53_05890 [Candidatus Omnitrophica bacterium]|nr:hypothetical protein [Candidatus Omnitrophota bacterium]